jgi:hypothetical protein
VPPEDYQQELFRQWITQQPNPIPDGWYRDGITPAANTHVFSRRWYNWVPRMPLETEDLAWYLERAYHFLGPPIPLVYNSDFSIFTAGGLLFFWGRVDFDLRVVSFDCDLPNLVHRLEHGPLGGWFLRCRPESTVEHVGLAFRALWMYECGMHGRNRWQELKDRGGDVHADWIENAPPMDVEFWSQE